MKTSHQDRTDSACSQSMILYEEKEDVYQSIKPCDLAQVSRMGVVDKATRLCDLAQASGAGVVWIRP